MNKLYHVTAWEESDGKERSIEFLVEAKTLPSANKKAFRCLRDEWPDDDTMEVTDEYIEFDCGLIRIPLKTIRVEETTLEEFAKRYIREA